MYDLFHNRLLTPEEIAERRDIARQRHSERMSQENSASSQLNSKTEPLPSPATGNKTMCLKVFLCNILEYCSVNGSRKQLKQSGEILHDARCHRLRVLNLWSMDP